MTKATSSIHILLVDDEPDILEFLAYGLNKEGYQITTAANGYEALDRARESTPDLIVLDLMMPKLDGISTYKKLRQIPDFQNVIITFLTAKDEAEVKKLTLKYGVNSYILKPIRPATFFLRIKNLLIEGGKIDTPTVRQLNISNHISLNRLTNEFVGHHRNYRLAKREFEALWLLANKPGQIFTAEEIRRHVYDKSVTDEVEVAGMMKWLHQKIGGDYIKTVAELGYKFEC
ncbi:MAG: response regulator transcription factor [Saprospiraceae bacterium]